MPKYKTNSKELQEYAKNQFLIFTKETGMPTINKEDVKFLNDLAESVEDAAVFQGSNFVNLNAAISTNKSASNVATEYLDQLLSFDINSKISKPYSDKNFSKIIESFSKCITNIVSAYKIEHGIMAYPDNEKSYGLFSEEKLSQIYETCYGGKNHYKSAQNKYKNLAKGVSRSKTMCDDAENLLNSTKTEEDIQKLSGVYMALKEKQKKNSIFTNWFNKKGYNEREKLKKIENALMEKLDCKNKKEFERKMESISKGEPESIKEIKSITTRDFLAQLSANKFNSYKEYLSSKDKQMFLSNQRAITDLQIETVKVEGEKYKIEVDLGEEKETSKVETIKDDQTLVETKETEIDAINK